MNDIGAPASFEPFFLSGKAGRLFSVFFDPGQSPPPEIGVLYVPPFADEMNRSRRQAALQARQLALCGLGTLMVDLYGTGDSEGDFADARWEIWIENLMSGISWLQERGMQRIILWGVRLGALLAADLSQRRRGDFERLVLWQPVISGKLYLSQFLRLRAAAEMISGEGGLDTKRLRAELKSGESVDVAGYELHPDFAIGIEQRDLREIQIDVNAPVKWIEVAQDSNQTLGHAAGEAIKNWRTSGVAVYTKTAKGAPFWTSPEITVVKELLETESFLSDLSQL